MSSTSQHRRHIVRTVAPIAAAILVLGLGTTPSAARPDPGTPIARVGHAGECLLERVGTQFVRCDNLTGNGVPAPSYLPEQ